MQQCHQLFLHALAMDVCWIWGPHFRGDGCHGTNEKRRVFNVSFEVLRIKHKIRAWLELKDFWSLYLLFKIVGDRSEWLWFDLLVLEHLAEAWLPFFWNIGNIFKQLNAILITWTKFLHRGLFAYPGQLLRLLFGLAYPTISHFSLHRSELKSAGLLKRFGMLIGPLGDDSEWVSLLAWWHDGEFELLLAFVLVFLQTFLVIQVNGGAHWGVFELVTTSLFWLFLILRRAFILADEMGRDVPGRAFVVVKHLFRFLNFIIKFFI